MVVLNHTNRSTERGCSPAPQVVPAEANIQESFGSWKTVWKRHRRFSGDGTWDQILTELLSQADAVGLIEWEVSVDSTVNRAHQHGATLARTTGGAVELHESAH